MLKVERVSVMNLENAIRGARNPMNSWGRMDSYYNEKGEYVLGENDLSLAVRLCAAGTDHRKFLRQVLVPGGDVDPEAIANAPGEQLDRLFKGTALREAAETGAALAHPGGGPLTDFERACDDAVMAYLAKARMVPFGVEPVIGYLYAREAEATAIRIILAGRMAGLDGATIRQRLRRGYC